MSAKILDGKLCSQIVLDDVKEQIEKLDIKPTLVIYQIGDDPASKVYVRNKLNAGEKVGINVIVKHYDADHSKADVQNQIYVDGQDNTIDGIMIQLPVPKGWEDIELMELIPPEKDVDGLTYMNRGMLTDMTAYHLPCTAHGIVWLLHQHGIILEGKHCVVIGRSEIVGKPFANLALNCNATVTICHSKTKNLAEITKTADILVVAVGREKLVTADMVKPGAVVVDVGINRNSDGKLCGDVDFDNVKEVARYITPVPGGVGPMTVAMLMQNTLNAVRY